MADHTGVFLSTGNQSYLQREKREEDRTSNIVFHWQCGHVSRLPLGLSSFSSVSEGDWMSIFGHVGAPADTVCLITRCLPSAGWLMGRILPFPQWSLIFKQSSHADSIRDFQIRTLICDRILLRLSRAMKDTTRRSHVINFSLLFSQNHIQTDTNLHIHKQHYYDYHRYCCGSH